MDDPVSCCVHLYVVSVSVCVPFDMGFAYVCSLLCANNPM